MFFNRIKSILVIVLVVFSTTACQPAPQTLIVDFLDIGQGDSILIQAPAGQTILIDGGRPDGGVVRQLFEVLPWYERTIDLMVVTHPDDDHGGGLVEVARRFKIGRILYTGVVSDTASYVALIAEAQTEHIPLTIIDRPQTIDLGGGATLAIVYPLTSLAGERPASPNDTSITARLAFGAQSFLFTGDLEAPGEAKLLASGQTIKSTVLKVGHHGSKYSTSEVFLEAVAPKEAVISVGKDNSYGHPTALILHRLARFGARVWRTDEAGRIEMRTDGKVLETKSEW